MFTLLAPRPHQDRSIVGRSCSRSDSIAIDWISQLSDDNHDGRRIVNESANMRCHRRLACRRRTRIVAMEAVTFEESSQGDIISSVEIHLYHPTGSCEQKKYKQCILEKRMEIVFIQNYQGATQYCGTTVEPVWQKLENKAQSLWRLKGSRQSLSPVPSV